MRAHSGLIAILVAVCSLTLGAQQPSLVEPQYVDQFFILGADGQLTPLEREQMHHAIKHNNIPLIKVGVEGRQDVQGGPASPVHVAPNAHFIVKMYTGNIDPGTLIHLVRLQSDKQGRYYVTGKIEGYVFTNGKSTGPQGDAAQLKIDKYGTGSLEVQPAQPLPAGEYAFVHNMMMADCFSVDPSMSAITRLPASQPKTAPAPPSPPVHPASSVLELAPAAPDFPPMHASNPAQDGCWWAPFISQKFGLEAAVSHCETNNWAVVAAETDAGITLASSGSSSPPEQVLTIETKPAEQTLEAAIKQQFIMKLKVPAARLSCRAKCESDTQGLSTCTVIATGSYAKLRKFNREDDSSEDPCPGLMTTDAITTSFLARPSESRTKFLLFQADDLGAALNEATIHFLAQP